MKWTGKLLGRCSKSKFCTLRFAKELPKDRAAAASPGRSRGDQGRSGEIFGFCYGYVVDVWVPPIINDLIYLDVWIYLDDWIYCTWMFEYTWMIGYTTVVYNCITMYNL